MKLYVLGPMTGYHDLNRPAFNYVATLLRDAGHDVISPVELDEPACGDPGDGSAWVEYLTRDLLAFLSADVDGGVALEGWENSKGAALEVHVLRTLGKKIYEIIHLGDDSWEFAEVKEPTKYRPPATETILEEAERLTGKDRQNEYGHPADDFQRIAGAWSSLFGWEVTPEKVALAQVIVKCSRLQQVPGKRDSIVDIAGYARTIEMILDKDAEA